MITESLKRVMSFAWRNKTITAKHLSDSLNLEKSTVSRNISKLRRKNVLVKVDELSPSALGGRKTIVYSFNKDFANILGISIEQDGIEYVKTNLFSEIVFKERINVRVSQENIIEEVDRIIQKHPEVIGIGISVPGIVENNIVIFSEALKLKNFSVEKVMKTEIPIFVEKDSLCGAIRHSLNKRNIIYFQFSIPYYVNEPVGFGVGIVIDGKPYYGSNNFAGEYKINKCIFNKKILFEDFLRMKVDVKSFFKEISKKMGIISSVFDPEIVVIGGNIAYIPQVEMLRTLLENEIYMIEERNMEILIEDMKEFVNAEGAAIKVLNAIFSEDKWLEYFYRKVVNDE
ncbi:ROK family transcriptional regulator [Thermosipho ferrireducens]|uniref:ROK family transcriptional regulator n=1 Tax=Thermosipho ferrireducens TaxID=2571116 RepID=A0ABX7SB59_9BACT|nr:ROK family transcriptional regulator [Thermosipho ferrireducens]QTA38733.1 ROK family transcriptional regulator [Thermosipho ferrireducens]